LPLGICEPHGQIAAMGLDTFKAEFICMETAKKAGGIVAPAMGYHVHEAGPSAKWLEQQVGETNPHMTSLPPAIFFRLFLYQLRAFHNAGFRAAVILSGHGGAHAQDLKKIAGCFAGQTGMKVWYGTDFELVSELYPGDHAGKYEISSLMHIRPDLVDFSLSSLENQEDSGGRLALGHDAMEASQAYGKCIAEACIEALSRIVEDISRYASRQEASDFRLTYDDIEAMYSSLFRSPEGWASVKPREGQAGVSDGSQWKPYEYCKLIDDRGGS
jgi:creatinine amidohydrolase